jgi:hypothetical protein
MQPCLCVVRLRRTTQNGSSGDRVLDGALQMPIGDLPVADANFDLRAGL